MSTKAVLRSCGQGYLLSAHNSSVTSLAKTVAG